MVVNNFVTVTFPADTSSVDMSLCSFFVLQCRKAEKALIASAKQVSYPMSLMLFAGVGLSRIVREQRPFAI